MSDDALNEVFEQIWIGDELGSRKVADYLTDYLTSRYRAKPNEAGFVMAINAPWGLGKSFMIEKWKMELEKKNYPTVYFDAWKNDFTPEPLVAFIAEIHEGLSPFFPVSSRAQQLFEEAFLNAKKVLKPALKAAGFALAKHALGLTSEMARELIDEARGNDKGESVDLRLAAGAKEMDQAFENAVSASLKEHKTTKEAIQGFKHKLGELVDVLGTDIKTELPIFLFVDELDRCRPDYAIKLLEGIKHLFGVPGIYFIIATNLSQLGESTKAVYGNGFDAHLYLKRFFDLEYTLPKPNNLKFAKILFSNIVEPHITQFETGLLGLIDYQERDALPYIFSANVTMFGCTLRDQMQIMQILEAAIFSLKDKKIHFHYLVFLAVFYHQHPEDFHKLTQNRSIGGNEISKFIKSNNACFNVPVSNSDFTTRGAKIKGVTALDVAHIYLNNAWTKVKEINTRTPKSNEFPENLITKFFNYGDRFDETTMPEVASYPAIIRHAGAFSSPNNN